MDDEFTTDEIREAVQTARIFSPSFSEEQFQASRELEKRLADSGYLEAVRGLARWEKERGVSCTEVLDACEQLLRDRERLQAEVAELKAKREAVDGELRQAREGLEQAREELGAVQAERQKEEEGLAAFRKRAGKEKEDIDRELEECRRKANVTREEIIGATQLKKQLASSGFTIQFTLDLCQEFVCRVNAREELAKAIEEHGTLTKSNAALIQQGEAQKEVLESELNKLQSEKERRQAEIKSLEQARHQLESILGQLQADVAHEEELRRFYHRYQGTSEVMEYLAGWREIYFVRCNNPLFAMTGAFDHRAGGAHFCVEKLPIRRCPCCDYPDAVYDSKFYQAFNLPLGTPIKLELGE